MGAKNMEKNSFSSFSLLQVNTAFLHLASAAEDGALITSL